MDKMQKITINTLRYIFFAGCIVLSTYHICHGIIEYISGRKPKLLELLYNIEIIAFLVISFSTSRNNGSVNKIYKYIG